MFVGQTRFSLFQPGSRAWKASATTDQSSAEEYRRYLYSDERMELRSRIFLEHSLPTILRAAQSHRIFHVVSISESLPDKYREMLEKISVKHECIVLDVRPDGHGPSDWRKLLDPQIGVQDIVGVYRLDDDDLLSDDFFDRMRRYISEPFVGMRVSFGLVAQILHHNGKFSMPRSSYHPMLGIGLTSIAQKMDSEDYVMPKPISHNRSDRVGPVILDSSEVGSLWIRSLNQDTAVGAGAEVRLEQLRQHLNVLDRIERTVFRSKFPSIVDEVSFGSELVILDRSVEVHDSVTFNLETPVDRIDFSYSYKGNSGLKSSDYIWSFRLRDGVKQDQEFGGTVEGLTTAPSEGLGHYRYARAKSGKRKGRVYLDLPEGIICDQIRISRHKSDVPLLILEQVILLDG